MGQGGSTPLIQAVAKGEVQKVQELVQRFPQSINQSLEENGLTALHAAAWFDDGTDARDAVIKELLARQADVDVLDKDGRTPLHYAAIQGYAQAVDHLLRAGADAYVRDKGGRTPLEHAISSRHPNVVLLLQKAPRPPPRPAPPQPPPQPHSTHSFASSDSPKKPRWLQLPTPPPLPIPQIPWWGQKQQAHDVQGSSQRDGSGLHTDDRYGSHHPSIHAPRVDPSMYPTVPTVYGTPPGAPDPITNLYPDRPAHGPGKLPTGPSDNYPEVFGNPDYQIGDMQPQSPVFPNRTHPEPVPGVPATGLTPWQFLGGAPLPPSNAPPYQDPSTHPPTYPPLSTIPPPASYPHPAAPPPHPAPQPSYDYPAYPNPHQPTPNPYRAHTSPPPLRTPATTPAHHPPSNPSTPTHLHSNPPFPPQDSFTYAEPTTDYNRPIATPFDGAYPNLTAGAGAPNAGPNMPPNFPSAHNLGSNPAGNLGQNLGVDSGSNLQSIRGGNLTAHALRGPDTHWQDYGQMASLPAPAAPVSGEYGEEDDDWGREAAESDWGEEPEVIPAPTTPLPPPPAPPTPPAPPPSAPSAPPLPATPTAPPLPTPFTGLGPPALDLPAQFGHMNLGGSDDLNGAGPLAGSGTLTPWAPSSRTGPPVEAPDVRSMMPVDGMPTLPAANAVLRASAESRESCSSLGGPSLRKGKRYTYEQLRGATNNFAPKNKVGGGGYGPVYRGVVDGIDVAIKCMDTSDNAMQGMREFQKEVDILSSIHHPHIVMLIGSCPERGMLVYDLMPNGSLDDHLFRPEKPPLLWQTRLRITYQLAAGLLGLHTNDPPIIHMDIKPGNVLLDRNLDAKLGDVGLSRLVPEATRANFSMKASCLVGTLGYMDPDYMHTGNFSPKSDVYSVGIVMLQLLTGRDNAGMVGAVDDAVKKADRDMGSFANLIDRRAGPWPHFEALAFAKLALSMVNLERAKRPDLNTDVLPKLRRLKEQSENYPSPTKPPTPNPSVPPEPPSPSSPLATNLTSTNIPQVYICPITQDVMEDPVFAADGYTYERIAIQGWLQRNSTSPMTNMMLEHKMLTPNLALRSSIKEWVQRNAPRK